MTQQTGYEDITIGEDTQGDKVFQYKGMTIGVVHELKAPYSGFLFVPYTEDFNEDIEPCDGDDMEELARRVSDEVDANYELLESRVARGWTPY